MPLPDGSAIELTIATTAPRARSLDGVGLDPDIEVAASATTAAESRAVEVLSGLLADAGTGGHG